MTAEPDYPVVVKNRYNFKSNRTTLLVEMKIPQKEPVQKKKDIRDSIMDALLTEAVAQMPKSWTGVLTELDIVWTQTDSLDFWYGGQNVSHIIAELELEL